MLEIKRERVFGRTYQVLVDGTPVARWAARTWKSGGRVELGGATFDLRSSKRGRSFEMLAGDTVQAEAHRSGRRWYITGDGQEYELSRPSALRGTRRLVRGGNVLGEFRRGRFGGGLTADLTDVPLPLQVFAGLVVVALWRRQDAATAAAASGGGG